MVPKEYTVTVVASDGIDVAEYLHAVIGDLEGVNGIERVDISPEVEESDRDISEVQRILGDLSEHEMENLHDAIDSYTEDEE